jgi:hypothetical protein
MPASNYAVQIAEAADKAHGQLLPQDLCNKK